MEFKMSFKNYSDEAINQVIEQCPGKPFRGADGNVIGTIVSARRIDGSDEVLFEIENG